MNILRNSFLVGIHSAQPQNLISKWLTRHGETLKIGERIYHLKDTYIVGFGKAVAGMVPYIENILQTSNGSYIKQGILSVPHGYLNSNHCLVPSHPNIKLYEGAKDNLPDLAAQNTAEKIMGLVDSLDENNLLLVLISGGGSALLPLPMFPLSLEEKTNIIKALSLTGATITEINTVRKAISCTKGGRLVKNSKAQVVSFILSDIINSPLGMIASGPTVHNEDSPEEPSKILKRYNIPMTDNLKCALKNRPLEEYTSNPDVYNLLIGDNTTVLNQIDDHIRNLKEYNCTPINLSSSLNGEASSIGIELVNLAITILRIISNKESGISLDLFSETLQIPPSNLKRLESLVRQKSENSKQSLCLLFGGETTVKVKGRGRGGRNQEMVLAASLELERLSRKYGVKGEVVFLSGGTDGIDGPTDAAGAITSYANNDGVIKLQTEEARQQGLSPAAFLDDNNSYEYFSELSGGAYLLKPGHTGTNVMDIQLLYIKG
ncbi:UNVERIFIED_CONTAM: hypothetical protein GTU68_015011 [Idotea baltica]|nr:hypothetical protein [Idotea baltica]